MGTISLPFGVAKENQGVINSKRSVRALVAGSTSYATGGDVIPLAALGLKVVDRVFHDAGTDSIGDSGVSVRLAGTPEVPLLRFFDAVNTEVANATNLSTRQTTLIFLGT